MSHNDLTDSEKRIKELVLKGYPKKEIASIMGKGERTIYNTIEKLERIGHLIHIPGTRSPKAYEDGISTLSLNVCNSSGSDGNGRLCIPPRKEDVSPLPFVTTPKKTVRVHFAGAFSVGVAHEGNFGRISDDRGFTVGGWVDSYNLGDGATTVYRGYIRIDGGEVKFHYYKGTNAHTMNIYPAERNVYYKHATKDGESAIAEQVSKVMSVLRKHGWGFDGNASPNGDLHYGNISPELLPHVNFDAPKEVDKVFCDRSHGNPEIETTARNPNAQNDIDELSELPMRLRMMEHFCLTASDMLEQLQSNQDATVRILARIQESQTTILELMTGVGNPSKEGYA